MDTIRHQVEASLTRTRGAIMEDRYRRLHHEQAIHQYWTQPPTQAVALNRFKRHLPAIPKRKSKDSSKKSDHFDVAAYAKHYKDKYGSVSAHSTSAIYGALRAPHYHAVYGASDMWYASVRSLNRGCHRDVVYAAEAYEWRETLYEDVPKEAYPLPPPMDMMPRPPCGCMIRRRSSHDGPSSHGKSVRHHPRCKYCTSALPKNGAANGIPPNTKRTMLVPEKLKPAVIAESTDNKPEATSRMSGYKKCIPGASKYSLGYNKGTCSKESGMISRKSILECDVTAYDLIKKVSKTPSVTEIDDSDIDDNLSDNAIARMNQSRRLKFQSKSKISSPTSGTPRHIANKKLSSKVKKSQSENCIYSESHSVLVGGQRIFTDNHRPKSPDLLFSNDSSDIVLDHSEASSCARWKRMSASEESVCIPDPDYDFSDESDDGTVINANCIDPKFTYSPPSVRKSFDDLRPNLGQNSRELSKSMSSLLSDDTYVPSINLNNYDRSCTPENAAEQQDCDNDLIEKTSSMTNGSQENLYDDNEYTSSTSNVQQMLSLKQEPKYESSSDCSSSGGTLSSDYPTWTSSSSNELKSILKKKKRREIAILELEDGNRFERDKLDAKEAQRKKQVQFRPGWEKTIRSSNTNEQFDDDDHDSNARDIDESTNYEDCKNGTVINDTYETIAETSAERNCSIESQELPKANGETDIGLGNSVRYNAHVDANRSKPTGAAKINSNGFSEDKGPSLPLNMATKLTPGRSSSLEDVRGTNEGILEVKNKSSRTRRRTTLPKRRFSDLHLHILLCPTRASLCGNGSSSDDMPLTVSTQRAHRSLPESPSEIDEVPSFCFDFLEKGPREKVVSSSRSVFYVPVDSSAKNESKEGNSITTANSTKESKSSPTVSPSVSANLNEASTREKTEVLEVDEQLSPDQYDTDEDNLENDYENLDPIYEELSDISNSSKRMVSLDSNQKSFFEGASKTDILSYLEDAKERGLSEGLSEDEKVIIEEEDEDEKVLSGEEEDTGEKNRVIANNSLNHKEVLLKIEEVNEKDEEQENTEVDVTKNSRISEVERNDSGVGTETSKPSRMKVLPEDWEEQLCADCDNQVEPIEDEPSGLLFSPLVCRKCEFRRSERKEIIIEFVDTELKYGRDLRIITEEFYRPMEIAGLLAKDQLLSIFLNLEELAAVNIKFSEKLQDALDIAMEHGDEDYTTVNLGKIFLETSNMLHAFETYCIKQASASVLLSHLEKEKELLRIFLRVSQMENTLLRRMNLPAFLMVPVQRVTRYPLLLSRLHKVTPIHHKDRNAVKEAQQKVELHLEHINQQTKGVGGTKIWRRISNISASHRRLGKDIGSIKLRKMALEILNWKQDETRFVMAGKLLFTQITDYPWNKKGKTIKFTPLHALLIALGKPNSNYRPESTADNPVLFPRNTGIRDASLVLMKEKNGRFIVVREPLYLGNCVISCESENDDVFEIQEYATKEAYLLKGETKKETKEWLRQLRYHAKDLGSWRKRRNALANIMINGMIRQ